MRQCRFLLKTELFEKRSGSAQIVLLIIVALVVIIFFTKMYLKQKDDIDPDTVKDLAVWKEWDLRTKSDEEILEVPAPSKPSAEQAQIKEGISYDLNVKLKDAKDPRAEMAISIDTAGGVWGRWYGQYYIKNKKGDKINLDIMSPGAGFTGSICPGKVYEDEYGEDPSKLYFIAKGDFLIQRTNFDVGTVKNMAGEVYVTGWLNKDLSVNGEIIITSNRKYFETFVWSAKEPLKENALLPGSGGL